MPKMFSETALAILLVAGLPVAAQAQSGRSASASGSTGAEVIEPARLIKLADLRFGAFARPTLSSTLTIAPNGTATATGEIVTTMNIAQPSTGRGAAVFRIDGSPNRLALVLLPSTITITSGSNSMVVDSISSNMPLNLIPRLDGNGIFNMHMGGRLRVNGGQAPGNYTGDFTVTVIFL